MKLSSQPSLIFIDHKAWGDLPPALAFEACLRIHAYLNRAARAVQTAKEAFAALDPVLLGH